MLSDLRRHKRFLVAVLIGFLGGLLTWFWSDTTRILFGADLFFVAYLASTLYTLRCLTPEKLAHHADDDDEGMPVILFLSLTGIGLSMFSVVQIMRDSGPATALSTGLALASIPLGWAVLHGVMAFHYASLWHAPAPGGGLARGLDFPGQGKGELAGIWDFIYYSFTLGMTAQTSDVAVTSTALRRVTIVHSGLSFFYNAVLVALTVNAAVSLGQ